MIAGYRFILGREPESEDIITHHRRLSSLAALRDVLVRSQEFRSKYVELVPPELSEQSAAALRALRPVQAPCDIIRVGGPGDGGYLLPDDLNGIEVCFSPGVGNNSNFENELSGRGIRCFLADFSVDEPGDLHPMCTFDKKFVGPYNNERYITLESWVEKYCGESRPESILQMDIEGGEFTSILATPRSVLKMFRIIVLELHSLNSIGGIWYLHLFDGLIHKLKEDFHIVHLHPNNNCGEFQHGEYVVPRVLECTLMRRDRFNGTTERYAKDFPHPLDEDNAAQNPTLPLHPSMYGVKRVKPTSSR